MENPRESAFTWKTKWFILFVLIFLPVQGGGGNGTDICKELVQRCKNICKQSGDAGSCDDTCKSFCENCKRGNSRNICQKLAITVENKCTNLVQRCKNICKQSRDAGSSDDENGKDICKKFVQRCKNICKQSRDDGSCEEQNCEGFCADLCDNKPLSAAECGNIRNKITNSGNNNPNTNCSKKKKKFLNKLYRKCLSIAFKYGLSDSNITQENQKFKHHSKKSSVLEFKGVKLVGNSSWVGEKTSNIRDFDFEVDLPAELSRKAMEQHNDLSRITLIIYNDTSVFEDAVHTDRIHGCIFEIIVGNSSIQNLTESMTLTIRHNEKRWNKSRHQCVFLYESENDTIEDEWKPTGCITTMQDDQTICQCNHLSYFAVLMDFGGDNTLDENVLISLMYISQIGCGISAIFSAVTIILYCAFRKVKSDQVTKIHMNLCAAIFLLNVNFLSNVWLSTVKNNGLCKTIAVCLHYSLLCTFTWMGIEAFQLYLMLIKVFNTYIKYYMQKLAVIGWGIPAIVVFVCIGVEKDTGNYGWFTIETQEKNSTVSICWITNSAIHYVTNCGYFSILCFGNLGMLITVCAKLFCMQRGSSNEQRSVWKDLWTVLGLCCLLGTTWALAFFSFGPLHVTQMYLFSILNSLQGFFIFLWYCVMKRPFKRETTSFTTTTTTDK